MPLCAMQKDLKSSRLKMDNFSGKFRRFVLENSQLTIPCEQISEICLETLPIFITRKPKTQVRKLYALPQQVFFKPVR